MSNKCSQYVHKPADRHRKTYTNRYSTNITNKGIDRKYTKKLWQNQITRHIRYYAKWSIYAYIKNTEKNINQFKII